MAAIGFIGLGHMGNPMVKNLLKAGHRVSVYDINTKAVEALKTSGAVPTKSLQELVQEKDVVFTMLQTGEQVESICLGETGIFSGMQSSTLFIDCSSIAINVTRKLHAEAKKAGLTMIDAPVSGGVKGAEAATLTIMVGGTDQAFQQAKKYLEPLAKLVIHAGPAGSGQVAKICNNMILGVSMIVSSEAFVLANQLGLDPKKFHEIVSNSSGQCWTVSNYCPMPNVMDDVPANNNYSPGFTAAMMLKDLNLSQDAAAVAGVETKMGATATEIYRQFVESNHGELDFSGILQMVEARDK